MLPQQQQQQRDVLLDKSMRETYTLTLSFSIQANKKVNNELDTKTIEQLRESNNKLPHCQQLTEMQLQAYYELRSEWKVVKFDGGIDAFYDIIEEDEENDSDNSDDANNSESYEGYDDDEAR